MNRRRLVILGALVLVFTVVGFLVLPPIIKGQLEKRMSAELGRTVTVERVHVNPYALSLAVDNLAIREKDGTSVFLGWRRLYVRLDPLRSLWKAWGLSQVDLDGFHVRVAVGADRAFNFADILARVLPPPGAPASSTGKPGRPITVGRLAVSGASLEFSDRSRQVPFATTVGPMTFLLSRFSTAPQVGAPYRFEAVTESGERFAWSGTLQAEPLASVGGFKVENLELPKYAPYYADQVNADLTGGMLSASGRYELSLEKDSPLMRLHDGDLRLRGLKLTERASHEVAVDLPVVDVVGVEADALARKAAVKAVTVTGGRVQVRRDKDGAINLLAMARPAVPSAAAAPAAPGGSRLPDASVDRITASNLEIDFTDLAGTRPARIGLKDIQFSLERLSLSPGASMPLALAFNWSPQGGVKVGGEVSILPVKAQLKVDVAGFGLLPLSPYLEKFVNARVTQGALTANLAIEAKPGRGLPVASVAGDVKLDEFGLVDGAHSDDLAGVRSVRLRGIRAATSPDLSLKVEEITIDGPYLRGIVNPDRSVNLLMVVPPGPAGVPSRAEPNHPGPTGRPQVEIGQVTLSGGSFRFVDRSLEPNAALDIEKFGGTIKGLSSTHLAQAEVNLSAVVGEGGPVSIVGTLDPLGAVKRVDLSVDCKNIDLVPLSPYSGKFAGYELARGKLGMAVKLQVDDDKIDATNVITLDRFTFGEAVSEQGRDRAPGAPRGGAPQGRRRQDPDRRPDPGTPGRSELPDRARGAAGDRQPADQGRRLAVLAPRLHVRRRRRRARLPGILARLVGAAAGRR